LELQEPVNNSDVTKMKLDKLLYEMQECDAAIDSFVKSIYERRNQLRSEAAIRIIAIKKDISGLVTAPLRIKLKDKSVWELRPEYMSKEGYFKNTVWKNAGADMFTIKQVEGD
jgi:hypothetical protein